MACYDLKVYPHFALTISFVFFKVFIPHDSNP